MTKWRISVLAENTAGGRGLLGEHGLSFWIEGGDKRILFDTGQGVVLGGNARQLGVAIERADAVVLSHGHYDHTGGLAEVLAAKRGVRVYAHPDAFGPKFSRSPQGVIRDVSAPLRDERRISQQAELAWVTAPTEAAAGLWLTGPIPRVTDFEDTGGQFFTDRQGAAPDNLMDDQAAYLATPAGTIVILGCAHAGVINTLHYIRALTDERPIHTVIGGMHLLHAGPERMDRTVAALRDWDIQRMLPCHCTGFDAMARLWREFPGRCSAAPAGTMVDMPN